MSEQDALKDFDWNKVTGSGLFVKFEAGKPLTLRVLTTDPVVSTQEFRGDDDEITLTTKFNFIVYNFTQQKAQILSATANMGKKIGELHNDPDFGSNIKNIDIKITPTGERLQRRYDIQVLPKANKLTAEQVAECRSINLDEKIENGNRMSIYDPSSYEQNASSVTEDIPEDITDEEISLDDIPF
jgi:hypothetical protein